MAYLNLHRTLGTDLVDPVAALDNNWDQIDAKFRALDSRTSPVGTGAVSPAQSIEFVSSQTATPEIAAYDGAAYNPIDPLETWGAWQTWTLSGSFTATARPPRLRVSNKGRVQCRGAVQYQTGTTTWPAGYSTINTGQFAAGSFAPITSKLRNLAPGPITGTTSTSWAYGQAYVQNTGSFLQVSIMYVGAIAAAGNYIDLAGLNWSIN